MNDNQKRFAELYKQNGGVVGDEMEELFSNILTNSCEDDPALMDRFVASLNYQSPSEIDQLRQENAELKQRIEFNEETMLEIADMVLGGGV